MQLIRNRLKYAVLCLGIALFVGVTLSHESDAAPAPGSGGVSSSAYGRGAPAAAMKAPPGVPTNGVAIDGLRLRTDPSLSGAVKGLLYGGDRVFIRERFDPSYNPNWVGVTLTQQSKGGLPYMTRGYVHKEYLH